MEEDNESFRWIGKIFNLRTMELFHSQILDRREAFQTVNVKFPEVACQIPDFLKGKLKTFLLNQNTFYFNREINSDALFLRILPDIVQGAFLKLDCYLVLLGQRSNNLLGSIQEKRMAQKIGYRIQQTLQDVAKQISQMSSSLVQQRLELQLYRYFLGSLKKNLDNKLKFYLKKHLEKLIKSFDHK